MEAASTNSLKEYIRGLYELERAVYLQEQVCLKVKKKFDTYKAWKPQQLKCVDMKKMPDSIGSMQRGVAAVILIVGLVGGIMALISGNVALGLILLFGGTILGIFLELVENVLGEETSWINEEQKKIDAENKNISLMNSVMKTNNERAMKALNKEYVIAFGQLKETRRVLELMYQKNLIFEKYHNLVAVSSFYEYLSSGRCTCLEGHEGAYNIFEMEVRQNTIIRKLDEVISKLDRIEQNQYLLYSAISTTNNVLRRMENGINESMQKLDSKMDAVVENTYISSYNSERILENERFRTFLALNYYT